MSAVLADDFMAEQGSAAWLAAKCGKLGASRFADAVAVLAKGGWAKSRYDLAVELVAERLTGSKIDGYVSREMLFGIENEPAGVAAYEAEYDVLADPIGWVQHPTIEMAGASPDRAIGDVGLLEMKAPKSTTFVAVRLAKQLGLADYGPKRDDPDDGYLAQGMWQLACKPSAQWCDLAYYDPRMPIGLQIYVRRIHRDEKIISAMEDQAREFLAEVDALEAKLRLAA